MSFEGEIMDLPAKIGSYRDAGYDPQKARLLAHTDMLSAAEEVLKQDQAEPVAVEIADLDPIPVETIEDIRNDERHTLAVETLAIVNACRRHDIGLNDTNYKMLAAIQNSLLSRNIGIGSVPKMEAVHAEGIKPRDLTIHMEDASKVSLKEIWKKIKQSFIDAYNRIKSWYIKAFDATTRLGKKAAAVKTTAENKQGAMNNTAFDFNGLKTLAMDGKVPEPANFANVIQQMSGITQNVLGKNAETYNKLTEGFDKVLQELIKQVPQPQGQQGNNTTQQPGNEFTTNTSNNGMLQAMNGEIANLKKSLGGDQNLELWQAAGQDERFKDLASSGQAEIYKSKATLPGDKMLVVSIPNLGNNPQQAGASDFKEMKLAFGATVETTQAKPRELEDSAQFRTLNQSQIVGICDSVMEACTAGLNYKLLFQSRDKAFQNLGRQLEQTVNQADNLQGQAMTYMRANISACTTIFNKINSGEGRWYRYSMGVFSKAVDYCQQSLGQIQ